MDDKFAGLFKESKIFADREVLSPHYLPQNLLFRDKQIDDIIKALTPSLKGERGRNLFVYGKAGTGKTSCVRHVIDEVKKLSVVKARLSYINCRIYNSRYRVLSKIVSDHLPFVAKRGYGLVEIYEKIINWIEEDGKVLVVVLDEIDMVKDLDDLVYTLTRANSDIRSGGITIVGVSNRIDFKEMLDSRTLSTLYERELAFPPYNSNELAAIIKDRVEKGFKAGVIGMDLIALVAAVAAKESGDARLALKVLSRAGERAEEEGRSRVNEEDINEAQKDAEEEVAYDVISTLPEHQKLVLYSIALLSIQGGRYRKLSEGNDTYIFSGEVYNKYSRISDTLSREPKSSRWYRKYISDLEMQGLIETCESGKGIRGHTKLIKLSYPAEKIKETIERSMFAESEAKGETKPAIA
jgi:cell division control protein 6